MRKILFAAAATILAAGCGAGFAAQRALQPSGESGERRFDATGFNRVELAGPFNVVVSIGGSHAVRAEGDTGLMQHLDVRVEGERLKIGLEEGFSYSGDAGRVTIHVTTPTISAADIAGSGNMRIAPFETRRFAGAVAGSGNLVLERLQADDAVFDIAGSGDVRAAGAARETRIEIAGSGSMRMASLQAARAHVSIVGSGDAELNATETATVEIVGSGNVALQGGARCSVSRIGSGNVRCG
jgi:hypothetical protein